MRTYKAAQAAGHPHDEQNLVVEEATKAGLPPDRAPKLFTGTVWGEVLMPRENGACSNKVTFAPGSRSAWHRHEGGQDAVRAWRKRLGRHSQRRDDADL